MNKLIWLLAGLALASSCSLLKKEKNNQLSNSKPILTQNSKVKKQDENLSYQPSRTRIADLLHTKLDVRFDMEKAHLLGRAQLTFKPYFFPMQQFEVDAKGFEIHSLKLVSRKTKEETDLNYEYDGLKIKIDLGKSYLKTDTFDILINYTAKPNELKVKGSVAINDAKGLYFINNDKSDPNKPVQIWTQGETESSSCWFPTIDAPNEKTSQELCMTVDTSFITLSNGKLDFSLINGDGTRTDCWRQDKVHTPYLFMMAAGKFAVVKDKWRNIELQYIVEPEYKPYAKEIYNHTPEMLEFFSKITGVDYPWDKYAQIIVRDYVSGAMENTSAVIFGDFCQKNHRELYDDNNDGIVAHEMFHHWFGDLVTCESWSNLPLNESFATYAEYLWTEYKYGKDEAELVGIEGLAGYLREAKSKQVDMIRYKYADKEDMFDAHSYSKGGRILHALRNYVGDEAFFESIKTYLTENAHQTAEIHHLRLAFEKVTGEDLNWFFNQWFLAKGHAELEVTKVYDDSLKETRLTVKQKQNLEETPLYRLPIRVEVHANGMYISEKINITKKEETFILKSNVKPDWVNFDADHIVLGVIDYKKPTEEIKYQYEKGNSYWDRRDALEDITENVKDSTAANLHLKALNDKFWEMRSFATYRIVEFEKLNPEEIKIILAKNFETEKHPAVRAAIVYSLAIIDESHQFNNIYEKALIDSSYSVVSEGLLALSAHKKEQIFEIIKQLYNENNKNIVGSIGEIIAEKGTENELQFFDNKFKNSANLSNYALSRSYTAYLKKQNDKTILKGLPNLEKVATSSGPWWSKVSAYQGLIELDNKYTGIINESEKKLVKANLVEKEKMDIEMTKADAMEMQNEVQSILKRLKLTETDPNLLQFLGNY